jgi:cellulose synthase/poly-beta-1,6-N-acetylglucosamine synthase-like glycosyltransferase
VVAADGSLYAVRRALFVPIANPSAADDMAISMRVVLQGYRLTYAPGAVAYMEPPTAAHGEFARKVRIANQVIRALFDLGPALWRSGFYSLQLLSHKLLRYLVPFFLLLALASNAALVAWPASPLWVGLLTAQLLFYGFAIGGLLLPLTPRSVLGRLLAVPPYFCLVNAAALVAVLAVLRGERGGAWTPRGGFDSTDR